MSVGEVKQCAHCRGSGKCSCEGCRNVADVAYGNSTVCSACGGKGSVWVGPEIVQVPSTPNKS